MNTTTVFNKTFKLLNDGCELIISQGGTSSSKTYSILQLIITLMSHPSVTNKTFSIVSESMPHLSKGAMFDFFKILEKDGLYQRENHNISNHNYKIETNLVQFFSVEDEAKVRGPRRDFLFINECNNIKYDTFRQLNMRTLYTTFLDFNPVAEFWAHQYIGQPKVGFIKSTYLDNLENTPQKIVDEIERMKLLDPNWYRVYGLGEVGSLEGLVFNNFTIEDFYFDSDRKYFGLDWGFTNDPTCLVSVTEKDKTLYVDELFYRQGLTNSDISNLMEQSGLRKRYDVIYCDSAEPKSIEELTRMGWIAKPALKGPDSVLKGIDNLKTFNIKISKRSLNLIKEMRNYQWQKDVNGKLINRPIGLDHAIDALRYVVGTHFNIKKQSASFSVI